MDAEDILRMAREVGLCDEDGRDSDSIVITGYLERFAKLVAAAEREACAVVVEQAGMDGYGTLAAALLVRERGAP
jgi:hypothetical protein